MGKKYDFGLVGLGVMGRNFILNVAQNGFNAIGLDRDPSKVEAMQNEAKVENLPATGTSSAEEFINALESPRVVMLLVPAGNAVDSVVQNLLPFLSKGDIIIDGGNSFYTDTDRRMNELSVLGIHFFGAGVSGGSKGARFGPSIMPGGNKEAWERIKPIFEAVAAKAPQDNEPCVAYMGPRSAGNYVKMVHNGIEYAMMQMIAETYDICRKVLFLSNYEISEVFRRFNEGKAQSYLVEITSKILAVKDPETGADLVDLIKDKGKQKGTGKWTSQNAMDLGAPVPCIDLAVSMREISAFKDTREKAQALYHIHPEYHDHVDTDHVLFLLGETLYFSFLMAYGQGMAMLAEASKEYRYDLDLTVIPKIWRAGCIIRSGLLNDITEAYQDNDGVANFLLTPSIAQKVQEVQWTVRRALKYAIDYGVPTATISAALNYFDALRSGNSPMNLIQAQRDFFGSHTYERVDQPGVFHTDWE